MTYNFLSAMGINTDGDLFAFLCCVLLATVVGSVVFAVVQLCKYLAHRECMKKPVYYGDWAEHIITECGQTWEAKERDATRTVCWSCGEGFIKHYRRVILRPQWRYSPSLRRYIKTHQIKGHGNDIINRVEGKHTLI